jgi:hypothetical protein
VLEAVRGLDEVATRLHVARDQVGVAVGKVEAPSLGRDRIAATANVNPFALQNGELERPPDFPGFRGFVYRDRRPRREGASRLALGEGGEGLRLRSFVVRATFKEVAAESFRRV